LEPDGELTTAGRKMREKYELGRRGRVKKVAPSLSQIPGSSPVTIG